MDENRQEVAGMLERLYRATGAENFFDPPLIGVASAADPWFERYKELIGDFHWTPQEALESAVPGSAARSVIVWVLPVRENIRRENRRESARPAVSWAAMRSFGELANEKMREQLCRVLAQRGFHAAAPHLEQTRRGYDIVKMNFSSHWSERHAAFVAGLGTFGLSAGLITERGVAVRIGSVVTDWALPAVSRPYGDDPFAWCSRCGACARRCPAGAIGMRIGDRDKPKCGAYIVAHVMPDREKHYGWMDYSLGCGLCQTGVPCEFRRPAERTAGS